MGCNNKIFLAAPFKNLINKETSLLEAEAKGRLIRLIKKLEEKG